MKKLLYILLTFHISLFTFDVLAQQPTQEWVVGNSTNQQLLGPKIFRTLDFGTIWDTISRVPYPIGQENYSVFSSSLNTGYCGGTSGYTFKTTNGGFNWYQQVVPSNGFRRDFYFVNDSLGWSVGGGGQIFKTTNGGTYVGVEPISNFLPKEFKLFQNYPNPFNGNTNFEFRIADFGFVSLKVYNMLGRVIIDLINEELKRGSYRVSWDASSYASGTYFYRLVIDGNIIDTKKMILIK